jgi:heme A synthase
MKGYPKWFTARVVHFIVAMLFISGCLLIPTTMNAHMNWDVDWRLTSDARIWVTFVHVLFGLVMFALLGALWSIHMRYWWKKKKGRLSGGVLVGTFLVLGVTGLGILYAGAEALVSATALAHTAVGLLFVAPYLYHTVIRLYL